MLASYYCDVYDVIWTCWYESKWIWVTFTLFKLYCNYLLTKKCSHFPSLDICNQFWIIAAELLDGKLCHEHTGWILTNCSIWASHWLKLHLVQDLGAYFDSQLNMHTPVSMITHSCLYHCRRLQHLSQQLAHIVTGRRVSSSVYFCTMDYRTALSSALHCNQWILNAHVWMIEHLGLHNHLTYALLELICLWLNQMCLWSS